MRYVKLDKSDNSVVAFPVDFTQIKTENKNISIPKGVESFDNGAYEYIAVVNNQEMPSCNNISYIQVSNTPVQVDGTWVSPTYSVQLKTDDDFTQDYNEVSSNISTDIEYLKTFCDNKISSLSDDSVIAQWQTYKQQVINTSSAVNSDDKFSIYTIPFPELTPDGQNTIQDILVPNGYFQYRYIKEKTN